MLFGRTAECQRLDRLIEDARAGTSGALVLRGEAGIGKTALCAYAVARGESMRVLTANPAPAESELAFSGLADLVRPVLDFRSELPEPQAAALASALGIGPPLDSGRFTIYVATLALLAEAAERAPVLVVVDEAQWLDASSTEALLFATRRFDSDRIAVVFAVRDGPPTLFDHSELPVIRLPPLGPEAALALLLDRARHPIEPEVAATLLRAAGGNPLVLTELPPMLTPAQLAGTERLGDLPTPVTVERAFLRQVESLPQEARDALLVAAAGSSEDLDTILRALAALAVDPRSLEDAERAGLVAVVEANGIKFRHPLIRSAVYDAASPIARREAHRALAESAGAEQVDSRAWHLAAAAPSSDEEAAKALDVAALAAQQRGGHAEAASAFERAAGLGQPGAERVRRLREAAAEAWLVGRVDHARTLLRTALESTDDPLLRARIQHRLGGIEMWHGAPIAARELLAEQAANIEELHPSRAARMLSDAAWACFMAADVERGLEIAKRACKLGEREGGITETLAKAVLGIALTLGGEADRAVALFDDYLKLLDSIESVPPTMGLYQPLRPDAQLFLWFEQYDRAREVITRTIDGARAGGALGALPYALAVLSDLEFRTGNWAAASAAATEAVRIANETHQVTTLAFSLGCLARLDAAQGREEDCRSHSAQALAIAGSNVGAVVALSGSALGLLELGLGRLDQAVEELERLARRTSEHGLREPGVVQWGPDLPETYIRLGRADDAERALTEFAQLARKTRRTWALAAAARCKGLLAGDADFEAEFQRAFELHDTTQTPFERARTSLCLGERLRRARRRVDAREPLRSALETFERLGAIPWADRARSELAASGATARPREEYAPNRLTPQELQVAIVVARGATNKEAGAALFLSPKTIETHLGRVYRKLNVRSRTELAHKFGGEGDLRAKPALSPG